MKTWSYSGKTVTIVPTADIPTRYRPNGSQPEVVQYVLDRTPRWTSEESPIETVTIPWRLPRIVVDLSGLREKIFFARHVGHHARVVQQSPFVRLNSPVFTSEFTIELIGDPDRPRLVRAYPGDYIPPLPWQNSARDADGGIEFCREYWNHHAYLFSHTLVVGERSHRAPSWY